MNSPVSNIPTTQEPDNQSDDNLRERVQQLETECQGLKQQVDTARQQLLQTNKMIIVGQMMATVAHELNNPLNGVLGYSQLLMKHDVDDRIHSSLQIIEAEATRARNIVQTLLNFVRVHEPKRQLVSINQIVNSMVEIRTHHRHMNNIELTLNLDTMLPLTYAEPHQLGQVILNLVTNAEQAITDTSNGGDIYVTSEHVSEKNYECIRITVRDAGPGIPDDVLKCIFDAFFTTKGVNEGTGLGLSICKQIVEEHHGTISATSEEGAGTTFTFDIPVLTEDNLNTESTPPVPEQASEEVIPAAKGLVIDDEPVVCQFVEEACVSEGHEIDAVSVTHEAFEAIKKKNYDFIICDLKMPKVNGQTFYDVVKNYDEGLSRSIIFITGDTANLKTEQFFKETGNHYIYKPFQLKDLIATVNKVLTGQPAK